MAKVSQGGMCEVALGMMTERQGAARDIRDQGNTEAHDHMLVGQALKAAAELSAEFKARLAKVDALAGEALDRAYLAGMREIHAGDGAAFVEEPEDGGTPALRSPAASTHDIVRRHIGELDAKTTEVK